MNALSSIELYDTGSKNGLANVYILPSKYGLPRRWNQFSNLPSREKKRLKPTSNENCKNLVMIFKKLQIQMLLKMSMPRSFFQMKKQEVKQKLQKHLKSRLKEKKMRKKMNQKSIMMKQNLKRLHENTRKPYKELGRRQMKKSREKREEQ